MSLPFCLFLCLFPPLCLSLSVFIQLPFSPAEAFLSPVYMLTFTLQSPLPRIQLRGTTIWNSLARNDNNHMGREGCLLSTLEGLTQRGQAWGTSRDLHGMWCSAKPGGRGRVHNHASATPPPPLWITYGLFSLWLFPSFPEPSRSTSGAHLWAPGTTFLPLFAALEQSSLDHRIRIS